MIVHDLEQGSDAWLKIRAGRPTASAFSKIVTSKGEPSKSAATYALTLAAETFAGKPVDAWQGNEWSERGRALEDEALKLYEFTSDTEIERVGFVTDDDGIMGCSPDSFAGDDGLVEVKALRAENHIKAILYHRKNGSCPPDYVQQTQGQMMICERAWVDIVFYHDALPLLVIRQTPDNTIQRALMRDIPDLCKQRDIIVAALRAMGNGADIEPVTTWAAGADLNTAAPLF